MLISLRTGSGIHGHLRQRAQRGSGRRQVTGCPERECPPSADTSGGGVVRLGVAPTGKACQQRDEHLRVGGSPTCHRVPSGSRLVTVEAGRNVVKGLVVAGAAADVVDGGVDEAEVVMGVLVGQHHDSRPERRGTARAGFRYEVFHAMGGVNLRHAAGRICVGGHVGHAPRLGDPRHAILIGGACV